MARARAVAARFGSSLVVAAVLLAGRPATGAPHFVDYDELRRVRVIAVVGSSVREGDAAREANETARLLAQAFQGTNRVWTVRAERVSSVMEALQLSFPTDLLTRGPGNRLRVDAEKAASLTRRAGADSLLIPFWEATPTGPGSDGRARRRLHLLLFLAHRKEIVWEDAEASREGSPGDASSFSEATRATVRALVRRFLADWRLARDRG